MRMTVDIAQLFQSHLVGGRPGTNAAKLLPIRSMKLQVGRSLRYEGNEYTAILGRISLRYDVRSKGYYPRTFTTHITYAIPNHRR